MALAPLMSAAQPSAWTIITPVRTCANTKQCMAVSSMRAAGGTFKVAGK